MLTLIRLFVSHCIMRSIATVMVSVILTSLLLGSFVSLADHDQPPHHHTDWTKYEGDDGYMEIEDEDFNSDGYTGDYYVYVRVAPGGADDFFCGDYSITLLDEDGHSGPDQWNNYFIPSGCGWEEIAPFNKDQGTHMPVEEYYECMTQVGYFSLTLQSDNGGPGTYEWDTNLKIYVLEHGHDPMISDTNGDGSSFNDDDGCLPTNKNSFSTVLIIVAVVIPSILIGAVLFYRKKRASTILSDVAEDKFDEVVTDEESPIAEAKFDEVVTDEESPIAETKFDEVGADEESPIVEDNLSKFCPNCGHPNEILGKFCKDCGTKLS